MTQCPTCGSSVPDSAHSCPDCGMVLSPTLPAAQARQLGSAPSSQSSTAPATIATLPTAIVAGAVAQASLTLKRGGALTGERFVLGPSSTIGRFDPASGPVDVDIGPLPEAMYVSRHHAAIRIEAGGQWLIRDLGSRNGTFVRGAQEPAFARITAESALADGDEVSLGNARFVFRTGA